MLASYGEKNSNEAAARQRYGASALLVQLVHVHHNGVGTEAAVAVLCNICFLTKNQEAISAFAWGEPLLSLAYSHTCPSCLSCPSEDGGCTFCGYNKCAIRTCT